MQPVTIKNNHYSNTLWLPQIGLCLLALVLVWVAVNSQIWLLMLLPLVLLALYINQRRISAQSELQFSMRSTGQLVVKNHGHTDSEDMLVDVKAFWHMPQLLMLKIMPYQYNRPVYLTLFRSVIGAKEFSNLLIGLTELKAAQKSNHEYSK